MRGRVLAAVVVGLVMWGSNAWADGAPDWSVISGTVDAPGSNVLSMQMGWPGFDFGWQHGLSGMDVGVNMKFDYGQFYATCDGCIRFQWQLTVPLRFQLYHQDMVSVLLRVEPGLFTLASPTGFGFSVTPGGIVGFQVIPKLRLFLGVDLPMFINVVNGTVFSIAPLFGGGVEFAVLPKVQIGFNMRFGPDIFVASAPFGGTDSASEFGFIAQFTVGYRL